MLPNLLATSKPMTATLIGWPAAWLILGDTISRALRGDRLCLGLVFSSVLLAVMFVKQNVIPTGGENFNQPNLPFGTIMRQHQCSPPCKPSRSSSTAIYFRNSGFPRMPAAALLGISALAFLSLSCFYLTVAFRVTSINAITPNYLHLSEFAARLPPNAAFLVDEHERLENKVVEFNTDRTCYAATRENWPRLAQDLDRAGAIPYLVTPVQLDLPVVFVDLDQQRTVYACTPAARAAASPQ